MGTYASLHGEFRVLNPPAALEHMTQIDGWIGKQSAQYQTLKELVIDMIGGDETYCETERYGALHVSLGLNEKIGSTEEVMKALAPFVADHHTADNGDTTGILWVTYHEGEDDPYRWSFKAGVMHVDEPAVTWPPLPGDPDPEIVRIIYTDEDVRGMVDIAAEDEGLEASPADYAQALERAREWGDKIGDTASQIVSNQLESVILTNQP